MAGLIGFWAAPGKNGGGGVSGIDADVIAVMNLLFAPTMTTEVGV